MTQRLPKRACKPPHKHKTIETKNKNKPEHALVYKSLVCLNAQGMPVVWEGNDLGKLKCTGT